MSTASDEPDAGLRLPVHEPGSALRRSPQGLSLPISRERSPSDHKEVGAIRHHKSSDLDQGSQEEVGGIMLEQNVPH